MGFGSLSSEQRIMVLLELLGGEKFATQMRAAAVSSGLLGKNIERSGKQIQVATRRTFLANQALYTLRRYSFFATTAVIGLTAVVAKLGYGYLSAMQTARVALAPVIKDHAVLGGYLNELFKISKYSPFVLKDLAVGFRQLFAGLNPIGISAPTILTTIQSLTDFMSYTGKTGPGQFQRVALAIQHMAFAGRLTGYLVNQLSRDGIPIFAILNKEMGITGDQLHNISKMGIPASKVLAAINKYARESPAVSGAAMRLSLHTFSGLMQVARDSLSQLSGAFIGSSYKSTQGWLFQLLKRGGPLDRLSDVGTKHGGTAALMLLSKQLTGNTGLGKGFMLLLDTLLNIGRVFVKIFIPAIIIALHSLIWLYPFLKVINLTLGFMSHHAKVFAVILSVLATEFIVTHSAILGAWLAMKLFRIATFGALGPLKKFIIFLGYAILGPSRMITLNALITSLAASMRLLGIAAWTAIAPFAGIILITIALAAGLVILYFKCKYFRDVVNKTFSDIVKWSPLVAIALTAAFGPLGAIIGGLLIIIKFWKQFHSLAKNNQNSPRLVSPTSEGGGFRNLNSQVGSPMAPNIPVWSWLKHAKFGIAGHAFGGFTGGGMSIVGEHGPEIAHFPRGTQITANKSMNSVLAGSSLGGFGDNRPIIVQLVVDRQVLAEQVARANADKQARR